MAVSKLRDEDVLLMAEQILLREKVRHDFDDLSSDDQARLDAVLYRGITGLRPAMGAVTTRDEQGELEFSIYGHMRFSSLKKKQDRQESRTEMLYALMRRIAFPSFPFHSLALDSSFMRSKLLELLQRSFSVQEIAFLFASFSAEEQEAMSCLLPPRFVEDMQFSMQKTPQEEQMTLFDSCAAKASLLLSQFLKEQIDAPLALGQQAEAYLQHLRQELNAYCQNLSKRFGIVEKLQHYTPLQWTKLAGLLPRRDIAILSITLPEPLWKKLLVPLPPAQQQEVFQQQKFCQQQQEKDLYAFIDAIDSFKRSMALVNKVPLM